MSAEGEAHGLLATARRVGVIRAGIGVAALVAPGQVARVLLAEPEHAGARVLLRMFAGREIAMGVGQVLATRRGPAAARGWVEAGGLADGVDVIAMAAGGRGVRPWARWGGMLSALAATAASFFLARGLGGR